MVMALFLSACAGYRPTLRNNPLEVYGIRSISIPQFANHSIIPGISGPMTAKFHEMMSSFGDLRVISGENLQADAIMLGIVSTKQHYLQTFRKAGTVYVDSTAELKESIGSRGGFYAPSRINYQVSLRIIIIRNPTTEELYLARSSLGENLIPGPKVIINEVIALNSDFSTSLLPNRNLDEGGLTNFTNSKGIFRDGLTALAENAAQSFRGTILYAF